MVWGHYCIGMGTGEARRWNFEDCKECININKWKQDNISDVSGAIHVMRITAYSGATYIWGATTQVLSRRVGIYY